MIDDWKNVKLEDIATFYKGKGISKNDVSETGIECIRYGELYTKYNEQIKEIFSKTNISKDKLFLSKKNDILIPSSGETAIDLATT